MAWDFAWTCHHQGYAELRAYQQVHPGRYDVLIVKCRLTEKFPSGDDELVMGHCRYPSWQGCNAVPEDMHPKSFRGYIGHNTNILAIKDRQLMQVTSLLQCYS